MVLKKVFIDAIALLIFEQSIIEVNDTGTMLVKMAGNLVMLQGIRFSM